VIRNLLNSFDAVYLYNDWVPRYIGGPGNVPTRSEWTAMRDAADKYYESRTDERIEEINKSLNEECKRAANQAKTKKVHLRPGYVYLLKQVGGEHYKIGRTNSPQKRIDTLSVRLPFKVTLDHLIECDDYVDAEKALHRRYEMQRGEGEWFALTQADVEYIKSLAKYSEGRWFNDLG